MPREQITHGSKAYVLNGYLLEPEGDVPKGAIEVNAPQLHVSWTRADPEYASESHVQLCLEVDVHEVEQRAASNEGNVSHNWFYTDSLDRQTLNHLIRTLKRARDAAYGADE
jgi:hypothetical protein